MVKLAPYNLGSFISEYTPFKAARKPSLSLNKELSIILSSGSTSNHELHDTSNNITPAIKPDFIFLTIFINKLFNSLKR